MKYLLFMLLLLLSIKANATHQKAAEITYTHVSGYTYRITITSYTFTGTVTDRPELEISWGDGTSSTLARNAKYIVTDATQTYLNFYEGEHTYVGPGTYILSMTDPTRNGGVVNVPGSIDISMYVQTTLVISPFFSNENNSPVLTNRPIDRACLGQVFIHNPGAFDPDGDSLSYKLIACKMEEGMDIPGYSFPIASTSFSIDSKTGDVIWDAPKVQGEYNIAILIEEWKRGLKKGDITRDMQITVQQCDNRPPVLRVQNACAIAGDTLVVPIFATDPDSNDVVKIGASGELFPVFPANTDSTSYALLPRLISNGDTSVIFSWRVPYSAARKDPYIVYCKATDDGTPPLSDLKNFRINIALPAITLYPVDTGLFLKWRKSPASQAIGYNIYRSRGSSNSLQDSCVGGLNDSSYTLIATVRNVQDTFYRDISSTVNGMNYCYRVTVLLNDGSESLFSNEECSVIQKRGVPIITHTSIEQTDKRNGVVMLRWKTLSPYADNDFELYKVVNDTVVLIDKIIYDTVVVFYDSNLNTQEYIQKYMVALDTVKTDVSTTLWLDAFGYSRRVVLRWNDDQLWSNRHYRVFRAEAGADDFTMIGRTSDIFFVDTNVINDSTYLYYIEGEGSYFNSNIQEPLLNKSNAVSATPQVLPPCTPELTNITSSCEPMQNILQWSADGCEEISHYNIYFTQFGDTSYVLLETTSNMEYIAEVEQYKPFCYAVTATNIKNEESPLSNVVCVDNRQCFTIKLPNVFTPNNDGFNEVFHILDAQSISIQNFEIHVFDRWGKLVYKSKDILFEWKGFYMNTNNACPDGAYFYVLEYSLSDSQQKQIQNGSVVILR